MCCSVTAEPQPPPYTTCHSAVGEQGHVHCVPEDAHVAQCRLEGDGRERVHQDPTHGESRGGHEVRSLKPAAPAIDIRLEAAAVGSRGNRGPRQ